MSSDGKNWTSWQDPYVQEQMFKYNYTKSALNGMLGGGLSAFYNPLAPLAPQSSAPPYSPGDGIGGAKDSMIALVAGIANQIDPGGQIPNIFGLHRITPPHAATPYTVAVGNKHYLHAVFCLGYGPIEISDAKIGDVLISSLSEIQTEFRQGTVGQAALTLFTRDVTQTPLDQVLEPSTTYQFSTEGIGDSVSIDFFMPDGIYQKKIGQKPDGTLYEYTVAYSVGVNVTAVKAGTTSPVYNLGQPTITGNAVGALVQSWEQVLPSRDKYVISVTRVNPYAEGYVDTVQVRNLKAYLYKAPINEIKDHLGNTIPLSFYALRARGTERSQGSLSAFNVLAQRHLPVWNGSIWTTQATRSPAWAAAAALTTQINNRYISNSRLNADRYLEWANFCTEKGFNFDYILDQEMESKDFIKMCCAAGRALYLPDDGNGKHSVVIDKKRTLVAQYFTPRNARNFRLHKSWKDLPHAIKAQIVVAPNYVQDDIIVPMDGYTKETATKYETIQWSGTTSADSAYKLSRIQGAAAEQRAETFEFETFAEYLACGIGDLIVVTSDLMGWGLGEGRITAKTTNGGGECTNVTLDEPYMMASGFEYALRVRKDDGTTVYEKLVTEPGNRYTVTFATPIPAASSHPAVDDLALYGYLNKEVEQLIVKIEPMENNIARIITQDHSPSIYDADLGAIPEYDPNISTPHQAPIYIPPSPGITGIQTDETVMLKYGITYIPRIRVAFSVPPSNNRITHIHYSWKRSEDVDFCPPQNVGADSGFFYIQDIEEGALYDIQIRCVADNNYPSAWTGADGIEVIGKRSRPANVEHFYVVGEAVAWTYPTPPIDFSHFQIRIAGGENDNWNQAEILISRSVGYSLNVALLPYGTITLMIKAIDVAGNESERPAVLVRTIRKLDFDNVVVRNEQHPIWGEGSIIGGSISGGEVVADYAVGALFYGDPNAKFYSGVPTQPFYVDSTQELEYKKSFTPDGNLAEPYNIKLDIEIEAESYQVFYKKPSQNLFYTTGANGPFQKFYTNPAALFYTQVPYQLWPGVIPGRRVPHDIKIVIPPSSLIVGKLKKYAEVFDVPDMSEEIVAFHVLAAGSAIPLTKNFRFITAIEGVTMHVDPLYPNAVFPRVDATFPFAVTGGVGPTFRIYDITNTPTDGIITVKVKGW